MTSRRRLPARTPLVAALVMANTLVLSGCTSGATTQTVTVYAAASLHSAFTRVGADFAAAHPGTRVRFSFNGSAALVDQLKGGASADVLATADEASMRKATEASLIAGTPEIFATNTLTLVVSPGNPLHITGLDDSLGHAKLVVCAEVVPCGTATATLARSAGVALKSVSTEQKVTDVLGKVTSGEADAGIVYVTDAISAGDAVTTVAVAGADTVVNRYPIGLTSSSTRTAEAAAFVAYVRSDQGRATLATYGFGAP